MSHWRGCLLALVENGDTIHIDSEDKTLTLDTLAARRSALGRGQP